MFSNLRTFIEAQNRAAGHSVNAYTAVTAVAGTIGWATLMLARKASADLPRSDLSAISGNGMEAHEARQCIYHLDDQLNDGEEPLERGQVSHL